MQSFGERFGRLVRTRRRAAGLTQGALAERALGKASDKSRISMIERGRVPNPHQATIKAICEELEIDDEAVEICRYPDTMAVPKETIDKLAERFGYLKSDADLNEKLSYLNKVPEDIRQLKARLEGIERYEEAVQDRKKRIDAALDESEFEIAEIELGYLVSLQKTEKTLPQVRVQAQLQFERAKASLFSRKIGQAVDQFKEAANYFLSFDDNRCAQVAYDAADFMKYHAVRYDIDLLEAAKELCDVSDSIWTSATSPKKWAMVRNLVSTLYIDRGMQLSHQIGHDMYVKSLTELERARSVVDEVRDADWALVRNNEGVAYREMSRSLQKAAARENLVAAVKAHTETLHLFKKRDKPIWWAAVRYNLGYSIYLKALLSNRTEVEKLTDDAEDWLIKSQTVFRRNQYPTEWAQANELIGLVNGIRAIHDRSNRANLNRTAREMLDSAIEAIDPAQAPGILKRVVLSRRSFD
ncbi:helix-turn-helix domain-containing protein [Roseovarius nanhaiticus]|uniref:helix-turn-helix domain-containing protein n=1 Tax=Roseovarius nanhaiticus TaxID=573024 RepID=UPI0024922B3E|nr:helix-turn-helix transcriptional regulator [Roseovarius nanhaiticus]